MLKRPYRLLILALLLIGLIPNLAGAMLIELSLPEMVALSDVIVRGEVLKTECRWGASELAPGSTVILTDVTLAVRDFLKGASAESLAVITIEGGAIGDVGLVVEDMPQFNIGEDVVAFVRPLNDAGFRRVTNYSNGKYTLSEGTVQETGEMIDDFLARVTQAVRDQEER